MAKVFVSPQIKIDGTRLKLSIRLVDAGLKLNLYADNYGFIYYALRNMVPQSEHALSGHFSVSAYNSKYSNRAMYSVHVSATSVSPALESDLPTVARAEAAEESDNIKLKYYVMVYIIQNWDKWNTIDANKIEYGRQIMQLHKHLKEKGDLPSHVADPVIFTTIDVKTIYKNSNRPMETRPEEEVESNSNFPLVGLAMCTASELVNTSILSVIACLPSRKRQIRPN